jgi:hypothetical protein
MSYKSRFGYIFRRENKTFANFFRIQNSDEGILVFLGATPGYFFLHVFEGISTKNQYLKKN